MKKNYAIKGMSCGGCVNTVKRALLQVANVTAADLHLNPQCAELTMTNPVDTAQLQAQLSNAGNYSITELV